jgi:hypothetical protein
MPRPYGKQVGLITTNFDKILSSADTDVQKALETLDELLQRQSAWPLFADTFERPNNSDWAVNALAALAADPTYPSETVRRFDDTTKEGVGFSGKVPASAAKMRIDVIGRAITAPGSAKKVAIDLYRRDYGDNIVPGSWSSAYSLTDVDIPTNAYFQYDYWEVTLATWGITAGRFTQFEFCRDAADAADTLVGDYALLFLLATFI